MNKWTNDWGMKERNKKGRKQWRNDQWGKENLKKWEKYVKEYTCADLNWHVTESEEKWNLYLSVQKSEIHSQMCVAQKFSLLSSTFCLPCISVTLNSGAIILSRRYFLPKLGCCFTIVLTVLDATRTNCLPSSAFVKCNKLNTWK